jgi:hypothetical protein
MSKNALVCIAVAGLLLGCTDPNTPRIETYAPSADLTPATAATIVMGHIDTGFLFFGNTSIGIALVDEKLPGPSATTSPLIDSPPLLLAPGEHALLFRAFRDPVADYACMHVPLVAGHTYVVNTTRPEMENTLMWLEDKATAELLGQKFSAIAYREPQTAGALVRLILQHPDTTCPIDAMPHNS